MRSRILFGGVLLAAAVACTDSVTNPSLLTVQGSPSMFLVDDPPPPPMDSSMATLDGAYGVNVTYFYNRTETNAWISFDRNQPPGVSVSPNARVSVSRGRAAARGTLSIATSEGTWTANLANAISPKSLEAFASCKYECARLDMAGTVVHKNGETDNLTLTFQFKSAGREIDVVDIR